jgi:hypothetical protein
MDIRIHDTHLDRIIVDTSSYGIAWHEEAHCGLVILSVPAKVGGFLAISLPVELIDALHTCRQAHFIDLSKIEAA